VAGELPSLRQPDIRGAIEDCLREAAEKAKQTGTGFRVAHYAIQREHLHLIVEAHNRKALSAGLKGLAGRMAKRINKLLGLTGPLFADRYFERVLKTPKQVASCLRFVLLNERRHAFQRGDRREAGWIDPCSSGRYLDGWRGRRFKPPDGDPTVVSPRTWLLAKGWRRYGLIGTDEIPGQRRRGAPA